MIFLGADLLPDHTGADVIAGPRVGAGPRRAMPCPERIANCYHPVCRAIREYIDAGFDHLILTQIGPEQDLFFEFFERELRHSLLS
jgi:hypothetical protein